MHPTLVSFELFGVERSLGGYALMLTIGWCLAFLGTLFSAHRRGLDVGRVAALGGLVTGASLVGASLLFVVVEVLRGIPLGEALVSGGRVLFGAYLGGLVAGAVAERRLGFARAEVFDLAAPWLAAAHASGRVGCFLAGCCFGSEFHGPWAVLATHPLAPAAYPSVPRHPVQLYEAVAMLAVSMCLNAVPLAFRGARTLALVACVCLVRLGTELFRADVVRGVFGPLATSGWLALGGLAVAVALAWRFRWDWRAG